MTVRAPVGITLLASGLLLLRVLTLPTGEAKPSPPPDPHVRPATVSAERLLADGTRRSYTIARLIDAIERSDMIVYLQLATPPQGWSTSHLRLIGTGSDRRWRYASVLIDVRLRTDERLEMLAHELQHVTEIAEARDVRDERSLEEFYLRVGMPGEHEHSYETRRALLVQMQVGEELLASPEIAASSEPPSAESTPDARKLYDAYCAVCHGRNGRGRGEARTFLTATAPDLTLLKNRNGGKFPRASVEQCIRAPERRNSTAADSDMPVWTVPLSSDHNPGAAAYAESIAEYIESLQRRSQ